MDTLFGMGESYRESWQPPKQQWRSTPPPLLVTAENGRWRAAGPVKVVADWFAALWRG